jgi:hypothetical protein
MPVVGFLNSQSLDAFIEPLLGFRQGLKETGYVEGDKGGGRIPLGRKPIRPT